MINSKSACLEQQDFISKDKLGNLNLLKSHEKGNKSECIQTLTLGQPTLAHLNIVQYSDEEIKKEEPKIIIKIPSFKNRKSLCTNPTLSLAVAKNLFSSFNAKATPNILKRKSLTPVFLISKY